MNPCGDAPTPIGTLPSPSTANGGALRSQSPGTTARESATGRISLSGSIIRIDPDTGLGVPGNPWFSKPGADANEQRVIAYGLRNPFRFSVRGGTNEIWVGDVGWNDWEEIDIVPDAATMTAPLNYGWPCYEGNDRQPGYEGTNLGVCTDLYNAGASAVESPLYTYHRNEHPVASDGCPVDQGSALAGVAYYNQPTGPGVTPYPTKYDGALFFTDYNRKCIWVMLNGANGQPDPTKLEAFDTLSGGAVNLVVGPSGDIFYPNLDTGEIHRIRYYPTNTPPVPSFTTTPTSGPATLSVSFDAAASSDPDGDTLTYEWDLDGDGVYDDATGVTANRTYATGAHTIGLKVTDSRSAYQTTSRVISAGNDFPTPAIAAPSVSLTWKVGDPISFSGSASDPEDGPLAAADLSWLVRLLTCDAGGNNCVTRSSYPFDGVAAGTLDAPDWAGEGNNLLEFALTATDSAGLASTETVRILPENVTLSFVGNPSGLSLSVGSDTKVTPFSRTVIRGSQDSLSATSPQTLGGSNYQFASWSDGGAQSHLIAAPTSPTTYTAAYDLIAVITPGVGTVGEGDAGTATLSVAVTLPVPSPLTVTVQYQTIDSTATAPGDYTATSGTVTFAPGQTDKTVDIPIVGDTAIEPNEALLVAFSAPTNATIGGFFGLGVGFIIDDDVGAVTTSWTFAELPRVIQSATYLGQTPEQLQKTAVAFISYLLAISDPKPAPAPIDPPPASTGPFPYTTTWTTADVGALRTVEAQYSLTAEQAQKFGVQLLSFVLALGGH